MKLVYIYTLSDETGVRYVGKSISPKSRYKKHLLESKNSSKPTLKKNWIKSLINRGDRPILEIIDEVPIDDWVFWEMYWISQMKQWGFRLTNSTDGGDNPPSWRGKTHSEEHKEKLRVRMLSDKNPAKGGISEEWKRNISIAHIKNNFQPTAASESNKKKVVQLSLDGEIIRVWDSQTDAAKGVGLKNSSGISSCILGGRNKAGGYKWELKKD